MKSPGFFTYSAEMGNEESQQLVFLHNATQEEWQSLMGVMQPHLYKADEFVVRQGDVDDGVYFVVSGKLQVSVSLGDGSFQDILVLGEGAIFGEQSFFDRLPRSATVQGIEDGEVYKLSRGFFDSLALREPALATKVLFELGRVLSSRLRRTTKLIAQ